MRSRTSSPLVHSVLATCASASRSEHSSAKATRTFSPFSQANSKPSEHQRRFDRSTATLPSWLDHAEWLGLLLEYETALRRQKQFEARARAAKLRHGASVEDVDYQNPRGLDRALFLKLAACGWIGERRNVLITGASGLGKSWLASSKSSRTATIRARSSSSARFPWTAGTT